jgi:Glycosyl transferase family 2
MAQSISACLIVRDEEQRVGAALASVAFCDEIVVVDGGSTDRTVELARAAGARVIENPWPGFGAQRNVAIDHATGDWILELDADERITPPLQEEIKAFLAAPPHGIDMGALPLRDVFLGGRLGPSARYPVYRYRLFRRGAYRHDEGRTVHEGLWTRGPVHAFSGDLEHTLAGSLREAVADWWRYAALQAEQTPAASPLAYATGILVRPPAKAAFRIAIRGGWRDGWRGVLKIALDASSDAVVWLRVMRRGGGSGGAHFGQRHPRIGSVRLVAVATRADVDTAAAWLQAAREHGADVGLIADRDVPGLHVRPVARLSLRAFVRALDAEMQLRPVDALVLFGARARLLTRTLPAGKRGSVAPLRPNVQPADAVRMVHQATRDEPYPPPEMEPAA